MPENSATAIAQSQDGYLWFGTFNGLVRFDGVTFTVFHPANTPQLPSAGIVNLHLDKTGRFWVSTYNGLVLRQGASWRRLSRPNGSDIGTVRTFSERSNGDLLITTFEGQVYEVSGGTLAELPPPPGEQGQGYHGGVDEEGRWWVVQNRFIGRWEPGGWVRMITPRDLPGDAVCCAPSRHGGLWVLLGNELLEFRGGRQFGRRTLLESPGRVWSMSEDRLGNVWIASYNQGFSRVTPGGVMSNWSAVDGASDNGRCVFEDREGNLWLGTSGDGLLRLTHLRFQNFEVSPGRRGLSVHSVSADLKGGIWAATFGQGLYHLSGSGVANSIPAELTNGLIYLQSVLADRAGRLWVSRMGRGLLLQDQAGIRHLCPDANVIALFEDSKGDVWMSNGAGQVWRSDGNNAQVFGCSNGLPRDAVAWFTEDSGGAIWVASQSGVFRRSSEQGFTEVREYSGAPIREILCLKPDAEGSMWMGSSDRGLLRWKNGTIAVLDTDDGFPVSTVNSIVQDDLGFFWMTSGRQIVRANIRNLQEVAEGKKRRLDGQVFNASDGLGKGEFTNRRQPASTKDAQGHLWFATTKGIAKVDPTALQLNDQVPPVYVERIVFDYPALAATNKISGQRRTRGNRIELRGPFDGRVRLPPGSHRTEIHYTALSLAAPEKVQFQVRLEGMDREWQDAGQRRTVFYDQLPPRDYVFRVRGANNDGVWNESGATLAFTVLPYFWQTWWFQALVVVGICGAGFGWYLRRLSTLEERRAAQESFTHELLLSQENERKRVASELHDGLGQDLLLIKNRVGLLAADAKHPPEVARQLAEISQNASRAIAEVRAISQALRPAALEQVGLTEALEWMVDQVAAASSTKFSAELENIDGLLKPEMEISLYRIVQEALNNILKHAQASLVMVEIKRLRSGLWVSVFDNGNGFDPAHADGDREPKPGFGLVSMKERAKVLGGRIDCQSTPGKGTRVTLTVPLPDQ